ncbi:unnamed protein product [Absidia cylindrospora]
MDPDDIIVALDISNDNDNTALLSDPTPSSPTFTPWSYPLHNTYQSAPQEDDQHLHSNIHGDAGHVDSERRSREYEHSIHEDGSLDNPSNYTYQHTNPYHDDFLYPTIPLADIQPNQVPPNNLNPRQQEEADQPVREGMRYLFDNKFMRARIIFQTNANSDPLYSLGLGAMAFIRAIMTHRENETTNAVQALQTTYTIAQAQIVNTGKKRKPLMTSFTRYFGDRINTTTNTIDPPTSTTTHSSPVIDQPVFLANSILRAHVVKAEASLLIAILQLTRASLVGYIKSGFHLRRAYYSYNLVWQEYKRMGQEYTKHMDRDTVSGIQFGIGAVQLILSSLPSKMVQINSILGWSYDKELGFVLLKLCTEARGIRSSLSSLVLLAYYNVLTSFAPQLYTKDLMESALACLTDAQHQHPRSCFFLFFAARFARCAQNLALSSQSFQFAAQASRGEWAEQAMRQLTDHEQAFNDALQLNWEDSLATFEVLGRQGYWSAAFSKYMVGACYEMLGRRTEAILAFAEVPQCIERTMAAAEAGTHPTVTSSSDDDNQHHHSSTQNILYVDTYIQKKVKRYQQGGYQYMDLHLPALEMLLVWNMFEWMEKDGLTHCLTLVQQTLGLVYERERLEYGVRQKELVPSTAPPHYYDKRAGLLLIKAAVLNALRQSQEAVAHLNWILDHQRHLKSDSWMVPFTYWESGVTCWHLGQHGKSRRLWQQALSFTDYDFEHRMTIRLGLALNKCDEMNIRHDDTGVNGGGGARHITKGGLARKNKGPTSSNGRKRMPLA